MFFLFLKYLTKKNFNNKRLLIYSPYIIQKIYSKNWTGEELFISTNTLYVCMYLCSRLVI